MLADTLRKMYLFVLKKKKKPSVMVFFKKEEDKQGWKLTQQQPFPVWPGKFSASNWSDQVPPSSITWGSVTHTSNLLAPSHKKHAVRCTNRFSCLERWGSVVGRRGVRHRKRGNKTGPPASMLPFHKRPALIKDCMVVQGTQIQSCTRFGRELLSSSSKMVSLKSKYPFQEWRPGLFCTGWKAKCTKGDCTLAGWEQRQPAEASCDPLLTCPIYSPLLISCK